MNEQSRVSSFAGRHPWLNAGLRCLLAIFGGYGLAALASTALALALPLSRMDAVMAATMLSFVIYLLAVIWTFAAATPWRAGAGLLFPAIALGAWLSVLPG
ncbi:MAG: iron transporter [Candidatus Accumulibacter sp.]|jgi:hypothetical protein|nr:iron transporter [Accumulibacter sp.]